MSAAPMPADFPFIDTGYIDAMSPDERAEYAKRLEARLAELDIDAPGNPNAKHGLPATLFGIPVVVE